MSFKISKLDHGKALVRERIFEFLAPHETHNLFILGNLNAGFPDSHLYVARRGEHWLGIAGYYGRPRSLVPFSREPAVIRGLIRHIASRHSRITHINGIDYAAGPACEELRKLGYRPANDPDQVFLELEGTPPPQPHEELARPFQPEDAEAVARLARYVSGDDPAAPVTEKQLRRVRRRRHQHVLFTAGKAVSIAGSNGKGIAAFQILGVATAPDYRNNGFARAVCASLIRSMAGLGVKRTVIFTARNNAAARHCYKGLGFRETGAYYVAKFDQPA